ncbi:MAG: putative zinc-binding protein [Candidatus Bathyarchaeia archaeon]|nr:hypothetical protein [Candidatus Bathyarchaeota archaeon]
MSGRLLAHISASGLRCRGQDLPNETLLLCLPAFVTGVEEDVKMVKENPNRVIAIEGCDRKCMSKILEGQGYKSAETIIVSHTIKEMDLKIDRIKMWLIEQLKPSKN